MVRFLDEFYRKIMLPARIYSPDSWLRSPAPPDREV